jgi:sugar O-acyltransferase (sialic acid O-acetyltransferase NeuD family)
MKHLIIIGARGLGREAYCTFIKTEAYKKGDVDCKGFLDDDNTVLEGKDGVWPPILGSVEDYCIEPDDVFICALGESKWRHYYTDIIEKRGGSFYSIIDSTAIINPFSKIGDGCYIGAFVWISPNVKVGKHVMIQAFCNLGHDASVDDYASLESYVFLGGYASLGRLSTMHTKSSIIPHKKVGNECVVGIDSVVIKKIKDGTTVFGNPAKIMKL